MNIAEILADLAAKARQATSGTWRVFHQGTTIEIQQPSGKPLVAWLGFDGLDIPLKKSIANAHHIAACSPDRILQLTAYVRELEEKVTHGGNT